MSFGVLGSEHFDEGPIAIDEVRKAASPFVKLHTVTSDRADSIDPVTHEVVRHRLWSITGEMGEALKRMSGSVVVTDANDFNFAITDELGQEVQIGQYNLQLAASMDMAIAWTLRHRSRNPGIEEGDMFLCNDPWVGGGLHQNDVSVFAPLFWDGELFGWSAATAHQLDLGGVAPGSWTPRSLNVFWESLPTPPIKVVRRNQILEDVEDAFVRRSHVPKLVTLDLRAMVGANKIAHERLSHLINHYGADSVKSVMKRMMDDAERRFKARLAKIPDGTWKSVAYQEQAFEGDRGVYKISLEMTKTGDRLLFDFRGTDRQNGMINCTYAGMRAGVLSPILTIVGGDLPWAPGGVVRCFEIASDHGTLNNATFPAGICKASVASSWATQNAVIECLSGMLDTSAEFHESGVAVPCGTWLLSVLAGVNQYENSFVTMLMEPMASGLGAKFNRDGVDTGGSASILMGRAPDAEMTEFMFPVLLIWRREEVDSGGPGRFRGGLTGSALIIPHGTGSPLELVCSGSGRTISMNVGLAGGYPGNNELALVMRESDLKRQLTGGKIPARLQEIEGRREPLPDETETSLGLNDAYFMYWQAGGGYCDPILRDAEMVERDVQDFKVTIEAAREIYGVVIDPSTKKLDLQTTKGRRSEIRKNRRRNSKLPPAPTIDMGYQPGTKDVRRVDSNMMVEEHEGVQWFACVHCSQIICKMNEDYLEHLAYHEGPPLEGGPQIWPKSSTYVEKKVVFSQYYCPGCFTAFLTRVAPA